MLAAFRRHVVVGLCLVVFATSSWGQDLISSRKALLERPGAESLIGELDVSRPGDREGFYRVLATPLFLYEAVGPFDLYVMKADGFGTDRSASKALGDAAKGLEKTLTVMNKYFGEGEGLIAGKRLPIVLTNAAGEDTSYVEMIALLDWAEGDQEHDWTGWTWAHNPLWDTSVRRAETARTWEAQIFNMGHPKVTGQGKAFYEHGLGYYTIAHVVASAMNQGAWGLVPPFVAQGLIDELDIQAYGEAWVGGDWWVRQTAGWFRPGWSGFLPTGMAPPPVVTGPPADLAVTVEQGGDSWQHRKQSESRHWADLVGDRTSEAPASFTFMAEYESFLPRDRALARCFMHLMLDLAVAEGRPNLLQMIDRVPTRPPSGMPDADPLPIVFSRALGGVPEVASFEAQSLDRVLQIIGHSEIAYELKRLGAEPILEMSDHRDQCQWLYEQTVDVMSQETRNEIWNLILSAEYFQQLYEWKLLGKELDKRINAALAVSNKYPKRSRDVAEVAEAFRSGGS